MIIKKGAMFGLDARIALAIFGALSVISGAALYSAIQESKVTAYLANVNEVSKAIEALMLDTGSDLVLTNAHTYDAEDLVLDRNSLPNWNGPYTSLGIEGNPLNNHITGMGSSGGSNDRVFVKRAPNTAWGDPDPLNGCDGSAPCYYWIETNCFDKSFVDAVDLKVDGTLDITNGKIRSAICSGGSTQYKLYFQSITTLDQG